MKTKPFALLATVTALMVAAAVWSTLERGRATASSAPPGSLFPNLVEQVNDITRINVHTPKLAFTIRRMEDGNWQVPERDGYPVTFATVKQAVVGIAKMRLLEAKTAKPALHDRLFLKSPKNGGRGSTIALATGSGKGTDKTIAAIVVGKTKTAPTENEDGIYYVRRLDDDQSYLAAGRVEAWESIDQWLDSAMPIIARQRVRAATTIQPDGARVGVVRTDPDSRDFKIANIPAGMKSMGDTIGNALGSALGFLSFEDVRRADRIDFAGAHKAMFDTFDGVTLNLLVRKHKEGHWLNLTATFDAANIKLDGLTDKQKKSMKSPDEAKAEVAHINKRYGPWAYIVPKYKAKDFMTDASSLMIEDKDSSK
ncbi:MAG: DUF4340 domain-containing protein [Alphaproteobacteria bacterium]|jgi:hypothetical protein|nr:DUF4340 domain-containing protein [Alphaproteobacteria bacterium]MDP6875924.1 DUF4340 domain-containing protein [Alphaproteobacteria bacterium]